MSNWYALPEEPIEWLVDGLITTDDCAAANGKPKSGKSTGIRNLIAAVVLGGKFLTEMSWFRPEPDECCTSISTARTDTTA